MNRRTRLATAALVVAGSLALIAPGIPASAETAAPLARATTFDHNALLLPGGVRNFQIYYSPGCTGASRIYSRVYTAPHTKEAWITDTFNNSSGGSAGLGQGIYHNAASVRVGSFNVMIWSGSTAIAYFGNVNQCFSLGSQRNLNTHFDV